MCSGTNPSLDTLINTKMLNANERSNTPEPIMAVTVLDKKFLPSPLIKNPNKGNNGIQ
jgi:hypothetical protein